MTKVFEINGIELYHYYPEYRTAEDTRGLYPESLRFVDAPDWCYEGCACFYELAGDDRFLVPASGLMVVHDGNATSPEAFRSIERDILRKRADQDMLEALDALISGDEHDWAGWVATIKEYILAVDATVEQASYPREVTYPDYPTRPWESE